MRRIWQLMLVCMLFSPMGTLNAQQTEFSADSALAYLEHLVLDIGPRPMGSRNERAAIAWAVEKFREFGADTAWVMPITHARSQLGTANTSTGVAVGVFHGRTDSSIVVGGHIDSSGPDIPGANDDASGTACVIELARVWSQRSRHYTMVYAAFGAEESGLIGSRYFAEYYEDIDRVALMLQIDMAGTLDPLIPFIDANTHQAPMWLVNDVYTMDRNLGYNSLSYPAHFFSLNTTIGGASSDHLPFLERDIPAIDLTSGIGPSPIHTPQDEMTFIDKAGLTRSGSIVDGLLQKYHNERIPRVKKNNYMLWQGFGTWWFIPSWFLLVLNTTAVLLAVFAFMKGRRARSNTVDTTAVRLSGSKLFVMLLIVLVFLQLGEIVMETLKGTRYPWLAPFWEYMFYAAVWAVSGAWVAGQLTKKWPLSPKSFVYASRALIPLAVMTALLALASARLALYPGLSLICVSLAILLPGQVAKVTLSVLSIVPLCRLVFMEPLDFMSRSMTLAGFDMQGFGAMALMTVLLTTFLAIWFFPTIYAIGYAVATAPALRGLLQTLRGPRTGIALLAVLLLFSVWLLTVPAFSARWLPAARIQANYEMGSGEREFTVHGNDYLRGIRIAGSGVEQSYDGELLKDELDLAFTADWLAISGTMAFDSSRGERVMADWHLRSDKPWWSVHLDVWADSGQVQVEDSNYEFIQRIRGPRWDWRHEPPESLRVQMQFAAPAGTKIIRRLRAFYHELPVPLDIQNEGVNLLARTRVTLQDTLTLNR